MYERLLLQPISYRPGKQCLQAKFDNSLNYQKLGGSGSATFAGGLSQRVLLPASLVSKKGILISQSDKLQYTRGSLLGGDGSGVVYENFDPNQGTLEFWVRPNWNGGDGVQHRIFDELYNDNNYITLYKTAVGSLVLNVKVGGTSRSVSTSISTWVAGTWYHIIVVWDSKNYVNGTSYSGFYINNSFTGQTSALGTIAGLGSSFSIGQDWTTTVYQFNGVIAGRILNRPLTSTEVTNLYASGAGHTDTFTVTPDTVWLGTYSDSDDDAVFQHRGQSVSAIANTATESALTLGQAVGSRSWKNDDRVVVWDGTGYKKEGLIDEASILTTDTSLDVDDGAGALVTDIEKVGVYATLNGTTQYFNGGDILDIGTNDIIAGAWVKAGTLSTNHRIFYKVEIGVRGYSLSVQSNGFLSGWIFNNPTYYQVVASSKAINDSKWHYIVFVADRSSATGLKLFVDGYETTYSLQNDPTPIVATDLQNAGNFGVGGQSETADFPGSIRDARIWIGNLGADFSNILTLATNPLGASVSFNSVAESGWWKFTDATAGALGTATTGTNLTPVASPTRIQTAFISKNLIADGGMEQGGIGGWSGKSSGENYSRNTSTITKDASIVKADTYSIKVLNNTANHSSHLSRNLNGNIGDALFVGDVRAYGTLNNNLSLVGLGGWTNTGDLASATNVLSLLQASDGALYAGTYPNGDVFKSTAMTVGQAGLSSGSWTRVETVADDVHQLSLSSGSKTLNDYANWDNVQLLPNLVNNGGMEGTYVSGVAPGWTRSSSGGSVASDTGRTGTYSQSLTGATGLYNLIGQTVSLTDGKYYTISFWAKKTGSTAYVGLANGVAGAWKILISVTSSDWAKYSRTFKYNTSDYPIGVRVTSDSARVDGSILYVDDISLIELDQVVPTTSTSSTSANSFNTGKWSDSNGAILSDGNDVITIAADTVNSIRGSYSFWTTIMSPYNCGEDKYLFDIRGIDDNNRIALYYSQSDDKFKLYINGDVRVQSSAQVNNSNFYSWHHWVVIYGFDFDVYSLYMDGVLVGSYTGALSIPSFGGNPIYVGCSYANTSQGDVFIDDFRVFNRQLNIPQISRLYRIGRQTNWTELLKSA